MVEVCVLLCDAHLACDDLNDRIAEAYAMGERLRTIIERLRSEGGEGDELTDELAQIATVLLGVTS
jgi:hypothetical protein